MMLRKKISRREFIRLSSLATAGLVAAACAGAEQAGEQVQEQAQEAVQAVEAEKVEEKAQAAVEEIKEAMPEGKYNEAPMLAELVKQGELPPVDQRLPTNPGVIDGMEGIGQYGGTIRRGFKGVSDRWGPTKLVRQGLAWYTPELDVRPNIAESWEINEDASEWTFHLRQGMKWSDGQPFDSDSFKWWYEHVLLNETLTPTIPGSWSTGSPRVLMEMEFPDQYTVKMKFAHPNPLFIHRVTTTTNELATPGHYMQQFHMDTTADPAALESEVKEKGFETWDQYFLDRDWWYLNPDRPSVFSFLAKNPLSEELFIMERNPYFWQVDSEGNQLPYLDGLNHRIFESDEVFNLRIVSGEVDFQNRHVSEANFTIFKEAEAEGDYRVHVGVIDDHTVLSLNQTVKNPRLREFFQNRNVRIAFSLAVNRDELNELAYDGLFTPRQYSPLEQSPQSYPKQANVYLDYDPERANAMLDEAGYVERDAEGFRLWKDGSGEAISFIIEGTAQPGTPDEDAVQIIIKYLADVGVKASYKGIERSLFEEHWGANEIDCGFWGCGRTLVPIVDAAFFLGTGLDRPWAEAWGRWRLDPSHPAAEEPPEDHWIRDIWSFWDQIQVEPDTEKQNELFFKILDIWAEEVPQPGYLGQKPGLIIIKNGLRGVAPDYKYPLSNPTSHDGLVQVQTFYWEDPENHT